MQRQCAGIAFFIGLRCQKGAFDTLTFIGNSFGIFSIGRPALSAIENGGEFKVQTLERLVSSLDVSEQYIMHGKTEDTKASLISEAVNVLSNMSELQIQQCLAMMKALKMFK